MANKKKEKKKVIGKWQKANALFITSVDVSRKRAIGRKFH